MKFIILLSIFAASFTVLVMPLAAQENRYEPRKYTEYSKCRRTATSRCVDDEFEWAQLDGVGNLLKADLNSNVYLIGYSGREDSFGEGIVHANYARNLLRRWVADDSRVRTIYGGRREHLTIEVWVVSNFLSVPQPTPTIVSEQAKATKAEQYYVYQHPYIGRTALELFSEYEYFNQAAILDGLAVLLEREPELRAYIIAYDGPRDRKGTAYKLATSDGFYLSMESHIPAERMVFIDGGRRENRQVELWVVPLNAAAPMPTPTIKSRTHRKR